MSQPLVMFTGTSSYQHEYEKIVQSTSFMREFKRLLDKELKYRVTLDSALLRFDDLKRVADTYDLIFMGLASPWSTPSRRTFQVAAWAGMMAADPDLAKRTIFVMDEPEPLMLLHAFNRAVEMPDMFLHDNWMGRPEAFRAAADPDILFEGCEYLSGTTGKWPRTIVPVHSWHKTLPLATRLLPAHVKSKMIPINVDNHLITRMDSSREVKKPTLATQSHWTMAAGFVYPGTTRPIDRIKTRQIRPADTAVANQVTNSLGLLVYHAPYTSTTTWSRYTTIGIASHAPVFAHVDETHHLGPSWAVLPGDAEEMNRSEQLMLSHLQKQEYLAATPSNDEVRDTFLSLLTGTMPRVVARTLKERGETA